MSSAHVPTGFPIPPDFDNNLRREIHHKVREKVQAQHPKEFEFFTGGWAGILWRFCACAEHDESFRASFARDSSYPGIEFYTQGKHLFEFFVNGQSALECLCFGLYSLGAMVMPSIFPMATEQELRKINPERTTNCYRLAFVTEPLTVELDRLVSSPDYAEWKEVRNILSHRVHPGRTMMVSKDRRLFAVTWQGINIDQSTTRQRRGWLADTINAVLRQAMEFTDKLL